MTEFEQAVADALAAFRYRDGHEWIGASAAEALAPRVAAAIAAAGKLYADAIDGEWGAGQGPGSYDYERATDEIQAAALAALRGTQT